MTPTSLLVIDDPQAAYLAPLRRLPPYLNVVISDRLDVLQAEASKAEAMLLSGDPDLPACAGCKPSPPGLRAFFFPR
jgi:hypothetical protein